MGDEYPKFSDFSEEHTGLEGDKKKIEEILNTEILVTGYMIGKSKLQQSHNEIYKQIYIYYSV
jgi:hypothetical protein